MTQESCFAFVINHLELQFDLPLEIASDYFLRRANDEQIDTFRDYLNRLIGLTHYRTLSDLPYERSHNHRGENGRDTYALRPLEKDQWKYYIINLESDELSKERFVDLQLSSNISDIELVFDSFIFVPSKTSRTYYNYPNILQRFIEDRRLLPPQSIQQEDVQQIGTLYNLMKKTEKDYHFIKRSIIIFDSLRNTPVRDDLRILGLGRYGGSRERFIDSQLAYVGKKKTVLEKLRYGLFLGSKRFVEKWKRKLETERDREKPQVRKALKGQGISVVLRQVFTLLGIEDPSSLLKPLRGQTRPDRDLAIYVLCHLGLFTHQEIGQQFGVGYTSISGALRRAEHYMDSNPEVKARIAGIVNDK